LLFVLRSSVFALLSILPAAGLSAQEAVPLDRALNSVTEYFEGRMPKGAKVAILGFSSESHALSDQIVEEFSAYIVNSDYFVLVDRRNLESIQKEMNFQLSGEVSDETVQAIGKKLGAESIILGSITRLGGIYRLRVRAVEVKTAKVLGIQNVSIKRDATLIALTAGGGSYSAAKEIHIGGGIGGAFNFYDTDNLSFPATGRENSVSLSGGVLSGFRIFRFLEAELGLLFTADSARVSVKEDMGGWSNNYTYTFNSGTLLLPVSLKIPVDTGRFSIAPSAGFYTGFPVKGMECVNETLNESRNSKMNTVFGVGAGLALGCKLGPGALFFDFRYLHDLNAAHIEDDTYNTDIYKARRILFLAGYHYTISFGGSK